MLEDIVINIENLSKCYHIYSSPRDRLLQMLSFNRKHYYREFWALKNISFKVSSGETLGIIGRNGSGKSTLLQTICNTLTPTSGLIHTKGRIAALLELGSGFNPEFTGLENVYLNAAVLGLTKHEIDERYDSISAFADIGDYIYQPVKSYSSGMVVRLAFSVIAHVDANILIIDEALAVGDAFFTQKCMRFLRSFMEKGTIVFVSHDTGAIRSLCSRAIWLENGNIHMQGKPKDVCESYLEAFFEEQQRKGIKTSLKINFDQKMTKKNTKKNDQIENTQSSATISNSASFGDGQATILNVKLYDGHGDFLNWISGGEDVVLQIDVLAHNDLDSPIIGFYIKDKYGQQLFGDNTYSSYVDHPVSCLERDILTAQFSFTMPRLARGDYSVSVAIANGSQDCHVQCHWIHDAIFFKSESTCCTCGILGIPMNDIILGKRAKNERS